MDLKLYLESRNISHIEFAKMIGASKSAISNYLCYRRVPSLEIGRAIEKVTNGKVTIDDLLAYKECEKHYG